MGVVKKLMSLFFGHTSFRYRVKMLALSEGTATEKLPCGCFLKAEHQPKKHVWFFTMDYSNCSSHKKVWKGVTKTK